MDSVTMNWTIKTWHKFHDGSDPSIPRGYYFYNEIRVNGQWFSCTRYGPLEPEHIDLAASELKEKYGRTEQEIDAFKQRLIEMKVDL